MYLPYGKTALKISGENAAVLHAPIEKSMEADGRTIVERAMAKPIGSPRLEELSRDKKTCVIIISDHTRPVPSRDILPPMLEAVRRGNPDIEITLLVATGAHRATTSQELEAKLGADIYNSEKIVVHDCDNNNVEIGILPSGAPLMIDRIAAEAELLIAEGFIEPHFFAGFSGGRKSVLPGICDRKTVLGNHCSSFIDSPFARTGILDGNPIHADMAAAAEMAGLKYIVNVIIDSGKNTIAAFAGDANKAHEAGTNYLSERCVVYAEPADIVVTTNGGAPLDQNIYQCVKGMTAGEAAAAPDGIIILAAECADGKGGEQFYLDLKECESPSQLYDEFISRPQSETVSDQWQSQILCRILAKHKVIMVTRPELESTVREMKMDYAAAIEDAMAKAKREKGENAKVCIIPDGVSVIVKNKGYF